MAQVEISNPTFYDVLAIVHPVVLILVLLAFALGTGGGVGIYISIGYHTTGELRKKSYATAFGFIICLLSVVVGNFFRLQFEAINPYLVLIGPILFYIGTFLFGYGFLKK
jgi:hypothetical protein